MKRRLVVAGDAQAQALAQILQNVAELTAQFSVEAASMQGLSGIEAAVTLYQLHDPNSARGNGPDSGRVIHFPRLTFAALWPLSCVNSFDRPEPPSFPHGRFPFGDSYVVSSVKRDTPPGAIIPFMRTGRWPASWPRLNDVFDAEARRLTELDAACDVKMAFYILKHFAREPLFHARNAPTNALLFELAKHLSAAVLETKPSKAALKGVALPELLGGMQVPVHPRVAEHFELDWYDPNARYRHRGGPDLSYDEYFSQMIAHSYAVKYDLPKDENGKTTLIVYGNCQAEALASILRAANTADLRVLYLRSFEEPGAPPATLDVRDVMTCNVLWEQHDEQHPFPYREWLPPTCKVVKFPATDFNTLWPLTGVNPFVRPRPPQFPFGRFPYGDRVIADAIARGMNADDAYAHFSEHAHDQLPDLDRFLAIETARLRARDAKCDVTMCDYILEHFRTVRLFWTVNHPTPVLLAALLQALILRTSEDIPSLASIDISKMLASFGAEGPLGVTSIPILPQVAAHFKLAWYDAKTERFQNWGEHLSFDGYYRALAADSREAYLEKISETAQ